MDFNKSKDVLSTFKDWIQKIILWITGTALILLMTSVVIDVILWSVFKRPMVALSELQWHFYGFIGMMGMSYTMLKGAYVRVDLIYDNYPKLIKKIIDTIAVLFFLIPLSVFLVIHGVDFVEASLRISEKSAVEGGLAQRWIPKAFLPFGATSLIVSSFIRVAWIWIVGDDPLVQKGGK